MAAKKKMLEQAATYPGDFKSPFNRLERMAFMKSGFNDVAWISRTRFTADQLRSFADWASKTADYIDSKTKPQI